MFYSYGSGYVVQAPSDSFILVQIYCGTYMYWSCFTLTGISIVVTALLMLSGTVIMLVVVLIVVV